MWYYFLETSDTTKRRNFKPFVRVSREEYHCHVTWKVAVQKPGKLFSKLLSWFLYGLKPLEIHVVAYVFVFIWFLIRQESRLITMFKRSMSQTILTFLLII